MYISYNYHPIMVQDKKIFIIKHSRTWSPIQPPIMVGVFKNGFEKIEYVWKSLPKWRIWTSLWKFEKLVEILQDKTKGFFMEHGNHKITKHSKIYMAPLILMKIKSWENIKRWVYKCCENHIIMKNWQLGSIWKSSRYET